MIKSKPSRILRKITHWSILILTYISSFNFLQAQSLAISDIGKEYLPDSSLLVPGLYYHIEDRNSVIGGNTSIRNETEESLVWKGSPSSNGYGYFQRNRDLGQVFNVQEGKSVKINALVIRSSRGNNAIMEGTPGAEMYVNFYEVDANPHNLDINDNNTRVGDLATHGFDHQYNRCDDYIEGEQYKFIKQFTGGKFPETEHTDQYVYDRGRGEPFGEQSGHLRYFKFVFGGEKLTLEGGKKYAFLIGFTEPGTNRGLALAIHSKVHDKENAAFVSDVNGEVTWGIRREGNGTLPPTMIEQSDPPIKGTDAYLKLVKESLFAEDHYTNLKPTSNGYPDVDTYRTLQFYLEVVVVE